MTTPKNTTPLRLDPKRKAKWVKALREDGYIQGPGQLLIEAGDRDAKGGLDEDNDRFCCLGVAANVCAKKGIVKWEPNPYKETPDSVHPFSGNLNSKVLGWLLGHKPTDVEEEQWDEVSEILIKFNDDEPGKGHKTFKGIASWIEKNL